MDIDLPHEPALDRMPALHSLIDGAALRQVALRDFGLRALVDLPLIQSGLNDHYALPTAQGEFVLRVYRHGWRTHDAVAWELGLLEHLASCGAPIAACVRRLDGGWFSEIRALEGPRQVAIFARAPGPYTHFGGANRHRVSPTDCVEQFGSSMAQVHAAADSYKATAARFSLDLAHLLDQPLLAIGRAYAHRAHDIAELQGLADAFRRLFDLPGRPQLDWGPCHGDMSGGNSTYADGRVIHFDFDCGGPGWRAYDLGVFFWSLSLHGYSQELWDRFMQGYQSQRTLGDADRILVPVFAGIRVIWLMGLWCANAHVFGSQRLHDDYLDRELARAGQLYASAAQLLGIRP